MALVARRVFLRKFKLQDLNDFFEYSSQPGIFEISGNASHKTIEEAQFFLSELISNDNSLAIVLKENQKVIGHISIKDDSEENRSDTKELGFVLNKNYHKKGIMSEAVNRVLEDLFSKNIRYVWACCFQDNIPSKKLIEKCGFEFIKEGTYYSSSLKKLFLTYEYRIKNHNL